MPAVVCSSCQVKINVKDEMLGKKAKCPKCATVIVLQAAPASPTKPARPAAPAESPVQAKAPAPKAKSAPPPLPAAEIVDEFEEIEDSRPRPKTKRPRDEDDDDLDDEPRARKRRSRQDDDDDYDDEPRARKRRRRDDDDEDDDVDDDRDDHRSRRRRPARARGGWASARSGLQLCFISALVVAGGYTLMQIVSMFAPMAVMGGPGGFRNPNAGATSLIGILGMLIGLGMLIAEITHFVGQCFCISAPVATAGSRAKLSVIFLVSAIVVAFVGFCLIAALGFGTAANLAQQQAQNPQNRQVIAADAFAGAMGIGIAGILVVLVVGGLLIASWVFWVLFHSAVADALRDRALQTQTYIFMASPLIALFLIWGISFALLSLGGPGNFRMMLIISNLLNSGIFIGFTVWYILINRRLARLIDVQGD